MVLNRAVKLAGPAGATAILLALAACGTIGNPLEALGAKIPPPDEFQVITHKPLMMPPSADLPEPRPGAASPLDPDPHSDALVALLGARGSKVAADAAPTTGEQALLASANAAAVSSEIRVQIEQDKIAEKSGKDYQPPSLAELVGFGTSEKKLDESELLDPAVEARRLQSAGQLTPVDPNATVEASEASPSPVGTDVQNRHAPNPIILKRTVPTY
jgi:hypothetical protein